MSSAQSAPSVPLDTDPAIVAARAAVLAEVGEHSGAIAPSLRPLTLNTRQPLGQLSAPLAAKLDARVQAGYPAEGDKYPTSRTWSRVVVPAIAVATVDLPVAGHYRHPGRLRGRLDGLALLRIRSLYSSPGSAWRSVPRSPRCAIRCD